MARALITVLYDGWSFIYRPNSPAALHMVAILANCPTQVKPCLGLPADPPAWLPETSLAIVWPTPNTTRGRLEWEQWVLPGMCRRIKADLLHMVTSTLPLLAAQPGVISPAGYGAGWQARQRRKLTHAIADTRPTGFIDRLRNALAGGGMARARGLFWPEDLRTVPPTGITGPVFHLPPLALTETDALRPGSQAENAGLNLPTGYFLYHGTAHPRSLQRLLDAWSWAAGAIGEAYPLLIVGLEEAERERVEHMAADSGLQATVQALGQVSPWALLEIYRGCSAFFYPEAVSPWGDPLRQALACGKPVVAYDSPAADAIVGPAAYLVPGDDARALGAALITVVVEEDVSQALSNNARERTSQWESDRYGGRLLAAYQKILAEPARPAASAFE